MTDNIPAAVKLTGNETFDIIQRQVNEIADLKEELCILIGIIKETCHCANLPVPEASLKRANKALNGK